MQPGRRATEVTLLSDGHEVAKQAQVHTQQRYPLGINHGERVLGLLAFLDGLARSATRREAGDPVLAVGPGP